MKKLYLMVFILAAMLLASIGEAAVSVATNNSATRARATVYKFRSSHPCPGNGSKHGACPGYVVDHIKALECGGEDVTSNMQWQTVAAAKAKDKLERLCKVKK